MPAVPPFMDRLVINVQVGFWQKTRKTIGNLTATVDHGVYPHIPARWKMFVERRTSAF